MCQKGWAPGSGNETDAGSPTGSGYQETLALLRCDFRSLPQQIATATNIRESALVACARSACRWSQFDPQPPFAILESRRNSQESLPALNRRNTSPLIASPAPTRRLESTPDVGFAPQ